MSSEEYLGKIHTNLDKAYKGHFLSCEKLFFSRYKSLVATSHINEKQVLFQFKDKFYVNIKEKFKLTSKLLHKLF